MDFLVNVVLATKGTQIYGQPNIDAFPMLFAIFCAYISRVTYALGSYIALCNKMKYIYLYTKFSQLLLIGYLVCMCVCVCAHHSIRAQYSVRFVCINVIL